jgi:hypothetical protein
MKVSEKDKGLPAAGVSLCEMSWDSSLLATKSESYPQMVFIWDIRRMRLHTALQMLGTVRSFVWVGEATLAMVHNTHRVVFWQPSCSYLLEIPFRSFDNMDDSKLALHRLAYNRKHNLLMLRDKGSLAWVRMAGIHLN